MAIAPDGKTAYVANLEIEHGDADRHRDQHGRHGDQGRILLQVPIAITPDGHTAYVAERSGSPRQGHGDADHHTPPTHRASRSGWGGRPDDRDHARWDDRLRHGRVGNSADTNRYSDERAREADPGPVEIPPGRSQSGRTGRPCTSPTDAGTVTPITTATNTAGKPIRVGQGSQERSRSRRMGRRLTLSAGWIARLGHGDADHDGDQHAWKADRVGEGPCGDRDHAGWEDGLRRQLYRGHGDADHDGDQHAREADHGREGPVCARDRALTPTARPPLAAAGRCPRDMRDQGAVANAASPASKPSAAVRSESSARSAVLAGSTPLGQFERGRRGRLSLAWPHAAGAPGPRRPAHIRARWYASLPPSWRGPTAWRTRLFLHAPRQHGAAECGRRGQPADVGYGRVRDVLQDHDPRAWRLALARKGARPVNAGSTSVPSRAADSAAVWNMAARTVPGQPDVRGVEVAVCQTATGHVHEGFSAGR